MNDKDLRKCFFCEYCHIISIDDTVRHYGCHCDPFKGTPLEEMNECPKKTEKKS